MKTEKRKRERKKNLMKLPIRQNQMNKEKKSRRNEDKKIRRNNNIFFPHFPFFGKLLKLT